MPYIDVNLGKIVTFGDIIKFVEKLKELNVEQDTPAYIEIDEQILNIVDMGANKHCVIFFKQKN